VGVVLLGTIVSDDPELSRAIIGDRESKNQEAYREGDAVGKYQIKKIMLGKVIIGTDEGNKLIAVVHKNDRRDPMIEEEKMDPDEAFFKELISEEKQSVRKKRKIRRRRARVSDLKASDE
jgi:type II secretory pathway component PulC